MNNKLEIASKTQFSQVAIELNERQKELLLKMICDLIDLPAKRCSFETRLSPSQNGLVVHLDNGYWGFQLDLFTKLHQLGIFDYSEKIPPPHYTDSYSGELATNSEDRAVDGYPNPPKGGAGFRISKLN